MSDFRNLTDREKKLLNKLIETPFSGSEVIKKQIGNAKAKPINEYKDNYGSIELQTTYTAKAAVRERVPVIGIGQDEDDIPIEILLHVDKGLISELEIIKADGSILKKFPKIEDIKIEVRFYE